jgi:hypothetical protein
MKFSLRRVFYWMGYLARGPVTFYVFVVGLSVYGVMLRWVGITRSLWLDEAWVANSVLAKSLAGMFYYESWLQSSPPLFLLLVRFVVATFGLSNTVLRSVPLLMGILAAVSMLFLAMKVLSRQYALLAWTLFVLSPVAIDYSRILKQYSSELAASASILLACTLYMRSATNRRFWILVVTIAAALLCGYAIAFLLPGVVFAMLMSPVRGTSVAGPGFSGSGRIGRIVILTALASGVVLGEYVLLVKPNSPEVLRFAWAKKNMDVHSFTRLAATETYDLLLDLPLPRRLQKERVLLSGGVSLITLGLILAWLRFRKGRRKWFLIQVLCFLPCVLLIICDWFTLYPFTERTSLFLLPCVVMLLVSSAQLVSYFILLLKRDWIQPLLVILVLGAIIFTIKAGRRDLAGYREPIEDMEGAVSFLHSHVQTTDFLWVHASTTEAFKLYARMGHWHDAAAHFGNTGWPCCARGIPNTQATSSEQLVRSNFGGALPRNFSGRVWLIYTTRPEHWQTFVDEPNIMQAILLERGCSLAPAPAFRNIEVAAFDCR